MLGFSLSSLISLSTFTTSVFSRTYVPAYPATGVSDVQYTAQSRYLDGPKVTPINSTVYEWWYFDVVSDQNVALSNKTANKLSSLSIEFYTASALGGFDLLAPVYELNYTSYTLIQVTGSFTNGDSFNHYINTSGAVFNPVGKQGINAVYGSGKNYFTVNSDLSTAFLAFDSPEVDLKGRLTIHSTAPSHAPCGPATAGADLHLAPNVGWVNLIADGNASGELQLGKETYHIQGAGYHDKNWGDSLFSKSVNAWYWGHAQVGDYSIVWFDTHNPGGSNGTSIYVAKDGKVLLSQCSSGLQIRPYGNNTQYPPHITDSQPEGYNIDIDTPQLKLSATIKVEQVPLEGENLYYRFIGSVIAEANGDGRELKGVASFEQFSFLP
jgi:hypothetical protein